MLTTGNQTVAVDDIRDAFTQVPRGRLLEMLGRRIPSGDVVKLVKLIIEEKRTEYWRRDVLSRHSS